MKKALIAFIVAFALSIVFTLLPIAIPIAFSSVAVEDTTNYAIITSTSGIFISFLKIAAFFVVFYFMAKHLKMFAVKSTIITVFLGAALGTALLTLLFNTAIYSGTDYLFMSLSLSTYSIISSVVSFVLPALTAMLYVELKTQKQHNNIPLNEANVPLGS